MFLAMMVHLSTLLTTIYTANGNMQFQGQTAANTFCVVLIYPNDSNVQVAARTRPFPAFLPCLKRSSHAITVLVLPYLVTAKHLT